jgi:hypothetical protein
MFGWTMEDWRDLGEAAMLLSAFVGALIVLQGLIRLWRKQPFWEPRDKFDLLFWMMIGGFIVIDPIERIFDRHGLPEWLILGLFVIAILLISQGAMRALARVQAENRINAVSNPESDGREPACKVELAPEDRKIQFRTAAVSIGLALLSIGLVFLTIGMVDGESQAGMNDTSGLIIILGIAALMLGGLFWLAKGRWPVPLTLRGEIDIAATPDQVWEMFHYRETDQYYRSIVRRVERLNQPGECYRLHYYNDERCIDCGLHKNPVAPGRTCLVEVNVAKRPSHMVTRSFPFGPTGAADAMMAYETSDMHYEPLPGGHCRVKYVNTVARARSWLALLLKMGDPIGEHLRDLKAHVEGGQGDTIYDRAEREIECARHVPQHCGCPPAMPSVAVTA